MKVTLNQINRELEEIQKAHLQVNNYYWGDFLKAYKRNVFDYTLMCCYTTTGDFQRKLSGQQIIIIVADKVYKDDSNLNDTESDTLQVLRDIFNTIDHSPRWRKMMTVRSASTNKFIERGGDEVAGHVLTLNVDLKDSYSVCGLPMPNYDFDFSDLPCPECESVIIYNEDLVVLADIPAGGTYTVEDSEIKNSDDSYIENLVAEGSLTLPDITITDSDGTTVTVPAVKDFVCTPASNAGGTAKLIKTGAFFSYRTGDDGNLKEGRGGFFVFSQLENNNPFGNLNRFTDELGGQDYVNDIVIDWATYDGAEVIGWWRLVGFSTWNNAIDNALSLTIAGFSVWRIPNFNEFASLFDWNQSRAGFSAPFNWGAGVYWTSTSPKFLSAQAMTFNNWTIIGRNKTLTAGWSPCRNFTNAELGI